MTVPDKINVFLRAEVPLALLQPFLQHVRDFDGAHPDCHFEIMADGPPDATLASMIERLRVNPELTFTQIFERAADTVETWRGMPLQELSESELISAIEAAIAFLDKNPLAKLLRELSRRERTK